MRKISHISLGRYLADSMELKAIVRHKKSFCLGNVLPDCKPSFLTTRHEFDPTFDSVKEDIEKLTHFGEDHDYIGRVYFRELGEVIHYIADYFTFPHNTTFPGTIKDHCVYESKLQLRLGQMIRSGEADKYQPGPRYFQSLEELTDYIKATHQEYLQAPRSVEEDCVYIINLCSQVTFGILYLLSVAMEQKMELVFA